MERYDWFVLSEQGPAGDGNGDCAESDGERGLFVVADGMGDGPAGVRASRAAVAAFCDALRRLDAAARQDERNLRGAVEAANREVWRLAQGDPRTGGLCAALSAAVLSDDRGRIVHVGDSRVYQFSGGVLVQLTQDHTLVGELVAGKGVTLEDAAYYPMRHALTRSLGTQETVAPDVLDCMLAPQQWLILTTDGVTAAVTQEVLANVVAANASTSAEQIGQAIMAAARQAGLKDNTTVMVVGRIGPSAGETPPVKTATQRRMTDIQWANEQ